MKLIIDGLEEYYSEKLRLISTLMKRESVDEYPEKFKWKLQMLYFTDKWTELCRIDNYPHEGKTGSHIHARNSVKRVDLDFNHAKKLIKEISCSILKEMGKNEN